MQTKFILIGGGWRAEFFMRLAQKLPALFQITAIVTINPATQAYYSEWGFTCVPTLAEALEIGEPQFAVVCVPHTVATDVNLATLQAGIPVLTETPVGATLADLQRFATEMPADVKLQVAEQYFLRPDMLAQQAVIDQGIIGTPQTARVSYTNNYHAIALMRKFLQITAKDTIVTAQRFQVTGQPGFGRGGIVEQETFQTYNQTLATFAFEDGKVGLYDFEDDQHRSFIRSQDIQIKGDRGEIRNHEVRYLKDFATPLLSNITRVNRGEGVNMEGVGLKGLTFNGDWVMGNPYPNAMLSDDELALGQCLTNMAAYVAGTGPSMYSFAEAAQDFYLTLLIEDAIKTGAPVQTTDQPWSEWL
ncbi:MAG: Gfo/Idh/MocA family oxidoreductase [Lactobacillaceae bacterium]|jgi:predicted dehydrogenase|nr:Gfo/Idh/MocA family oxidoreductase [Lactobacillaceae bacterium]